MTALPGPASVGCGGPFTTLPSEWLPDHWSFPKGELSGVRGSLPETVRFDWTGVQPSLAAELKWAIATRCLRGYWAAGNLTAVRGVMRHLMGFLREDASKLDSLIDRDVDTWTLRLRSHLIARGTYRPALRRALYTLGPAYSGRSVGVHFLDLAAASVERLDLVRSAQDGVKEYLAEDVTMRGFRQVD